jgi:hypothetical protein
MQLRDNTQVHNNARNYMSKAKNVEAFEKLVSICSGYGGYNPGKSNLTIQSLSNLLINAKQAVDDANVAKTNLAKESNEREVVFDSLPKLASSIVYTLAASGASDQTLNDARFFLRQLNGRKRKSGIPVPAVQAAVPEGQTKISRTPQASYVSKADHFGNLVKLVSAEPSYVPNEPQLGLTGLTQRVAMIQQLNSSVIQARSDWSNKKMARDKKLYADNSLIKTGRSVQKYVRAVYGLKSAEYKIISKLSFTKPGA